MGAIAWPVNEGPAMMLSACRQPLCGVRIELNEDQPAVIFALRLLPETREGRWRRRSRGVRSFILNGRNLARRGR
jgi:hypothetical protein